MTVDSAGRHTVVDWWTMVVAAVMMIRYWRGSERKEETWKNCTCSTRTVCVESHTGDRRTVEELRTKEDR